MLMLSIHVVLVATISLTVTPIQSAVAQSQPAKVPETSRERRPTDGALAPGDPGYPYKPGDAMYGQLADLPKASTTSASDDDPTARAKSCFQAHFLQRGDSWISLIK